MNLRELSDDKRKRGAVAAVATAALAYWAIGAIREKTGGSACPPLDDAFIHFQYARSFAEGHPLVYAPGDPATSGATSLLWSLVLAVPWKLGMRDTRLVWAAWAIGFVCLGLLALETRKLAIKLLPRGMADLAAVVTLGFGGHVWCAASAMEVVPFAFVMMRTARLAVDAMEGEAVVGELAVFGALAPLLRPEGALVSLLAAYVLFTRQRSRTFIPLLGIVTPPLVYLVATGRATASTTQVKWLFANPYFDTHRLEKTVLLNVEILFGQLLDGKGPAKTFIPEGAGIVFSLAPVALLFAAEQRKQRFAAFAVFVVGMGILVPTTYETFLANRLRYLWPFFAAWAIGLAAVVDGIAVLLSRFDPKLEQLRTAVAGLIIVVLTGKASDAVEDVAVSAGGVQNQQVSLARWASVLPANALVGVNDAGAFAYLSGRKTFDIVGLTTRGEAKYWTFGAGSRFEHYERLSREGKPLPTHFAVYPDWFGISPLMGPQLAERTVEGASVLGAPQMVATEANWSMLGSGEQPAADILKGGTIIDTLDVADVESESEHAYDIGDTRSANDGLLLEGKRLDGGRLDRAHDRFQLHLQPGGRLIMRIGTASPLAFVDVKVDGALVKSWELSDPWQELSLDVPTSVTEGRHVVEVDAAPGQRFVSLHHWSIAR